MDQPSFRKRMKRIFLNETGQMTIFIALIFQVLFVFFAMVINIGLLVHDKINLQNAVDFGAYYGAQRQAEIMNEIAHVNYQIRQDNKLLAWRQWVLGTLGRGGGRNIRPPAASDQGTPFSATDAVTDLPSICVANPFWREPLLGSQQDENYCWQNYGGSPIQKIPIPIVVAPFIPLVDIIAISLVALRNSQGSDFDAAAPFNWVFSAQMLLSYKIALTSRKAVIVKLRTNLVSDNMKDQFNVSVSDGVRQTILKNLTVSNYSSFSTEDFKFQNGLATQSCAGANGDGDPTLPEIRTYPSVIFTYPTGDGNGFGIEQHDVSEYQSLPKVMSSMSVVDPNRYLRYMITSDTNASPGLSDVQGLNASSLGFEKNPWCMAYVMVHAKTSPRKPFAPFGQSVTLEARSFAQPFGGRIGPWYKNLWPSGASVSSGARVDPLTSSRFVNGALDMTNNGLERLVNYSRFPGDTLGLRSKATQANSRNLLRGYYGRPNSLSYLYYQGFGQFPTTGDALAWDSQAPDQSKPNNALLRIRAAETMAVTPDLFDVTYYSIDPHYNQNYRLLNQGGQRFGDLGRMFNQAIQVAPDIGGRLGTTIENYDVAAQVNDSKANIDQALSGVLGYYITDIWNILTGWASKSVSNFGFPDDRFAKCDTPAKVGIMIPGGCAAGGRTGYSVRLISRDHLLSPKWQVGGEGQSGPIVNPPDQTF